MPVKLGGSRSKTPTALSTSRLGQYSSKAYLQMYSNAQNIALPGPGALHSIVNVTGSGVLNFGMLDGVGYGNTVRVKITMDGVSVYDKTYVTQNSYEAPIQVGVFGQAGTSIGPSFAHQELPFNDSLLIQIQSDGPGPSYFVTYYLT